ncbi:UNVERIFIED_CONTAM: hypothetical protein GTU68_035701, partial [Idotea baltica]|nr:hypothetical protein [Idotea baltica]
MLKSSAGGGGIGMQLCWNESELSKAFDSVAELSKNNFSNAALFLEKFVQNARHIEVQIFGNGEGDAITLGERDCSAQRRNQKVLEETPAPNLAEHTRQSLQEIAKRLVCSVKYRSAGTVEFILDADTEDFYFLEVNTRLQVEHGVTEEIYGVDIVRWMVELANSNLPPLADLNQTVAPKGHAIQARIYAEDPAKDFQPSAGLLSEVVLPSNKINQLRADYWIEAGIQVSPFFDPMLAKIIAVADTRTESIERLKTALSKSRIYGIETNLEYVAKLLDHAPIANGEYLT